MLFAPCVIMESTDYIALSIPVFFLLIGIELIISTFRKKKLYRFHDAITSISCGIGSEIMGAFLKTALFFGYLYIYDNLRIFTVPNAMWSWVLLFLGIDLCYYWFHRKSHVINILWAAHIVHHQSEDYNLSTALRQAWFQSSFSWVFYLPLALIGFEPIMFLTFSAFNTLYQFWIHTRAIGRLGFLEWFMNTPSHHRVHHGKNPKYLDKNYAAVFIIWDRMFGTFQAEEEEPVYGITKSLKSWNPIWTNFHYWVDLFKTAYRSNKLIDKINVFIKPPGWSPAELGGFQPAPEVDKVTYEKYETKIPVSTNFYVFFQFVPALLAASAFLFLQDSFSIMQYFAVPAFVLLSIMNCGAILEKKRWVIALEYMRFLFAVAVVLLFYNSPWFTIILYGTFIFIAISIFWFTKQLGSFTIIKKMP
ncbi:MAG: sterol desaturase family protein [Cytophagales bacterium]|nr:sterol desaturase family protein [Cytophagales bacterium]